MAGRKGSGTTVAVDESRPIPRLDPSAGGSTRGKQVAIVVLVGAHRLGPADLVLVSDVEMDQKTLLLCRLGRRRRSWSRSRTSELGSRGRPDGRTGCSNLDRGRADRQPGPSAPWPQRVRAVRLRPTLVGIGRWCSSACAATNGSRTPPRRDGAGRLLCQLVHLPERRADLTVPYDSGDGRHVFAPSGGHGRRRRAECTIPRRSAGLHRTATDRSPVDAESAPGRWPPVSLTRRDGFSIRSSRRTTSAARARRVRRRHRPRGRGRLRPLRRNRPDPCRQGHAAVEPELVERLHVWRARQGVDVVDSVGIVGPARLRDRALTGPARPSRLRTTRRSTTGSSSARRGPAGGRRLGLRRAANPRPPRCRRP